MNLQMNSNSKIVLMIFKQIQVDQNELTDEFLWFEIWIQMNWLMDSNDLTDEFKWFDRWIQTNWLMN